MSSGQLNREISQRLVELMDGAIGFESSEGEGATFWFTLPLSHESLPEENVETPCLEGVRVLIAGDYEPGREWLAELCGDWGLVVEFADSPGAA